MDIPSHKLSEKEAPLTSSSPPPPSPLSKQLSTFFRSILKRTVYPILLIAFVFFIDYFIFASKLKVIGIIPLDLTHIFGIFFAPFIHANFNHLYGNLISLWPLLLLLAIFYQDIYWTILLSGTFLSGLFTWITGNDGIHIGSSGVIYCLTTFIFFFGFVQKRFPPIFPSIIILIAYRYLISGLFPQTGTEKSDISYHSHWSGVIAGIILVFFFYTNSKRKRKELEDEAEDEDE